MEAKDKLLKDCIDSDETIRYLFYDKANDTQDNIKLSILANALEISFKAGQESREAEIQELRIEVGSIAFEIGKKAGRMEVADWVTERDIYHLFGTLTGQAKLKEWGIDDGGK